MFGSPGDLRTNCFFLESCAQLQELNTAFPNVLQVGLKGLRELLFSLRVPFISCSSPPSLLKIITSFNSTLMEYKITAKQFNTMKSNTLKVKCPQPGSCCVQRLKRKKAQPHCVNVFSHKWFERQSGSRRNKSFKKIEIADKDHHYSNADADKHVVLCLYNPVKSSLAFPPFIHICDSGYFCAFHMVVRQRVCHCRFFTYN